MSDGDDFDDDRVQPLLESLERMAGGDLTHAIAISPKHDTIDAIGFGINVLVGELRYASDDLRRARDEAESANTAKTAFLRNVSHEIRTPLTAILALTELLGRPDVEAARSSDLVARIRSNADALLGLVDELLDLSKVEAGKLPFEIAPMSPLDVATDVVRTLEAGAQLKDVRFVVEAAADTPSRIHSDRRRLRQILMNVGGNALKFTERGEIRVRLAPAGATRLSIDVVDTGIGLSAEQQRALFMPFQQATPDIAHLYGGSGLGLMLSKRFAEALGGDVTIVASAPGVGSTLRITLRTDLELTSAFPRKRRHRPRRRHRRWRRDRDRRGRDRWRAAASCWPRIRRTSATRWRSCSSWPARPSRRPKMAGPPSTRCSRTRTT